MAYYDYIKIKNLNGECPPDIDMSSFEVFQGIGSGVVAVDSPGDETPEAAISLQSNFTLFIKKLIVSLDGFSPVGKFAELLEAYAMVLESSLDVESSWSLLSFQRDLVALLPHVFSVAESDSFSSQFDSFFDNLETWLQSLVSEEQGRAARQLVPLMAAVPAAIGGPAALVIGIVGSLAALQAANLVENTLNDISDGIQMSQVIDKLQLIASNVQTTANKIELGLIKDGGGVLDLINQLLTDKLQALADTLQEISNNVEAGLIKDEESLLELIKQAIEDLAFNDMEWALGPIRFYLRGKTLSYPS